MKISFKNKTALITGGTRGIGKQIANDLHKDGANIIITGTKKDFKTKYNYFNVDFTNRDQTNKFLQKIEEIKKIDILINNAGICKHDYISDINETDWDNILNVNLKAVFLLTKCISKKMIANKYGRIVNITSTMSEVGITKRGTYCASKFALLGFTKISALELIPYNILVNSVAPGATLTDLLRKILDEKSMQEMKNKIPIKRLAMPQEISNIVLFLASNKNTYIVGQNIVIDGGYTVV